MFGNHAISLKEALNEFLKKYKYADKFNETRLQNIWQDAMGRVIAKHTRSITLRNKILSIELDSAALKNELSFAKEKIKKTLNNYFEHELIEEVRIK